MFGRHLFPASRGGSAEADDRRDVQGPRPQSLLVTAAVKDCFAPHAGVPPAHVERAHALGSADLVGAKTQEINPHRLHIDRLLPERLRRVGVEENFLLLADRADLPDRMEDARLVVRVHDGNQNRLFGDRVRQSIEVELSEAVNPKVRDFESLALEIFARIEDGPVLRRDRDDVVALGPVGRRPDDALDRQVVGLRGAAGEDNLFRIRVDQCRDLLPGAINPFLGVPAEAVVAARRVPKRLGKVGQHRVQDPRVHRCRRMVVHIDGQLHGLSS